MSIPVLEEPLEFLNNADLDEPFEFITDGEPEDFTDAVITASLVSARGRLDMSSEDGTIVKTAPGSFQFSVDRVDMWALPAAIYDFDIICSYPDGRDVALLRGKTRLVQGATKP